MVAHIELLNNDVKERVIKILEERLHDTNEDYFIDKCKSIISLLSSQVAVLNSSSCSFISGSIKMYRIKKNILYGKKDIDIIMNKIGKKEFDEYNTNISDYNLFVAKSKSKKDKTKMFDRINRLRFCQKVFFNETDFLTSLGKVAFEVDRKQCMLVSSVELIPKIFEFHRFRKLDFERTETLSNFINVLTEKIDQERFKKSRIDEILDFSKMIQHRFSIEY